MLKKFLIGALILTFLQNVLTLFTFLTNSVGGVMIGIPFPFWYSFKDLTPYSYGPDDPSSSGIIDGYSFEVFIFNIIIIVLFYGSIFTLDRLIKTRKLKWVKFLLLFFEYVIFIFFIILYIYGLFTGLIIMSGGL